jgi:hypothetical protein
MTDEEFLMQLADCRLPTSSFSHAAHVRLGYLCLRRQGLPAAVAQVRTLIQNYARSIGKGSLYDEAVTVAFLELIQEHMNSCGDAGGWETFKEKNPELLRKDAVKKRSRDFFDGS